LRAAPFAIDGSVRSLTPIPDALSLATFSCDVTPPIGHPLCGGLVKPVEAVNDPLLAKGLILSDGRTRYVLCALDWTELHTGAYDLFRRKLADAAEVNELQVEVHCLHQHDAPFADTDLQMLLDVEPSPPITLDYQFMEQVTDRVAAAARAAMSTTRRFTHIGYGKGKVEKFASSRRILLKDGSIGVRYSCTKDPEMIAAPEGTIDPWLRTITLFDSDRPLVRLHYYATHPMSDYGHGRVSADIPGLARTRLEQEEGIPQIYFTGCGGNVAAGKYNDCSVQGRDALAERLYRGMTGAIATTQRAPVSRLSWKTTEVRFALRTEPEFSEATFRKQLGDAGLSPVERIRAASALAWYNRLKTRPGVDVSCYQLGPVYILHLPGEPFVEYQLYAQSLRPSDFVAVAGYGENGPAYICTDKALTEGGYEPTWSFVGPPSEARLRSALADLLA
jgi:hypothetical protein